MKRVEELSSDELLEELGETLGTSATPKYTPRQERLLAGFEDILRFYETHNRAPQHGEERDIFERLYAVRLDQLRKLAEGDLTLLATLDKYGMLAQPDVLPVPEEIDPEALLAELEAGEKDSDDISVLRHVHSLEGGLRDGPHEIADRTPCADFASFEPLFDQVQADLQAGRRQTRPFAQDQEGGAVISPGDFFILRGQLVYVASIGESYRTPNGEVDGRLRVIYSNGTESNLLLRSLQNALYGKGRREKQDAGRRITQIDLGPLFSDTMLDTDVTCGIIYVLRSLSKQPEIAAMSDVLHKIGFTSGRVEARIANAETDPTYLLAPVEIVATWQLANINQARLEQAIHRVLAPAQLKLEIPDRFGNIVQPREWFLVPMHVIAAVVDHIRDGSISSFAYSPKTARLEHRGASTPSFAP